MIDYYYEILDFLNVTQYETDLKYYYVFVPYEDDLVYVWDAVNTEGACELGQHEAYMSEESNEELLPAVKEAIDDFVGDAPQFDDITMLFFEYKRS